MNYEISIIYGLPNQTLESFKETINWCLSKSVPVLKAFPLMLLRGTEIEKNKQQWGLIESDDIMPVVLQSNTFTFQDWVQMSKMSEALKESEDNHPKFIEDLIIKSKKLTINHGRFQPQKSQIKRIKV